MTIYDIAKKFNINISTVSKALNGSTDIAESTRKAICDYAAENGYKTRRSKARKGCLAVLRNNASDDNARFAAVIDIFCREAENENYSVSVLDIGSDFDLTAYLAQNNCCGVFLLGTDYQSVLSAQLKTTTIPVVVFGSQPACNPHVSVVKTNDLVAASDAVDHLVSLDHNLIAFLGTEQNSVTGAERFAGYFFGLSKNAIPYRYDLTYFGDSSRQSGANAAEYFLSYNKYFTAIVCTSEEAALGFVDYIKRAGKKVPEDISVVCLENSDTLTSVTSDETVIGRQAYLALKSAMKDSSPQHVTVPCMLQNPELSCRVKKKYYPADAD